MTIPCDFQETQLAPTAGVTFEAYWTNDDSITVSAQVFPNANLDGSDDLVVFTTLSGDTLLIGDPTAVDATTCQQAGFGELVDGGVLIIEITSFCGDSLMETTLQEVLGSVDLTGDEADEPSDDVPSDEDQEPDTSPPSDEEVGDAGEIVDDVLAATWEVFAGHELTEFSATAFGVEPTLLATNAHVVNGLAAILATPGGVATAVQNETGTVVNIVDLWIHPDYDGSLITSPDVGVLEVDAILPATMQLASDAVLHDMAIFDDLLMCGFPGDVDLLIDLPGLLAGDFLPRATCLTGQISSLRPFDPSEAATPQNTQLIQHDIATTAGTSGSAIFDSTGLVLAVNAGSTLDDDGLNRFAPRADTLRDLLDMIDAGTIDPVSLDDVTDEDDLLLALDGEWVMRSASGEFVFACMEFDQGTLVFYNVLCYVSSEDARPDWLDAPANATVEGEVLLLFFSYTIIETVEVLLVGSFVDEDRLDLLYADSDEYVFDVVLTRESFPSE